MKDYFFALDYPNWYTALTFTIQADSRAEACRKVAQALAGIEGCMDVGWVNVYEDEEIEREWRKQSGWQEEDEAAQSATKRERAARKKAKADDGLPATTQGHK